jgi:hypothetical protein
LKLTINETYGDKPISEWLTLKVKEYVWEKYGLDVRVTVIPKEKAEPSYENIVRGM